MKPYGLGGRDNHNCKAGCCATNYVKIFGCTSPGTKARRKTARQNAKNELRQAALCNTEQEKE
jgi:hypothetical protein